MNSTINNQTTFGMAFIKPTGESAKRLAHLAELPRNERAYKAWVNEANKLKNVDIEYTTKFNKGLGLNFSSFVTKDHKTGQILGCSLPYPKEKGFIGKLWTIIMHPEYTLHPNMVGALKRAQILEKEVQKGNGTVYIINDV